MSPPGPGARTQAPTEAIAGEFEQHARALLEDSVLRLDGRVRSRLNQARHAAIDGGFAAAPRSGGRFSLMPAASAVAAARRSLHSCCGHIPTKAI